MFAYSHFLTLKKKVYSGIQQIAEPPREFLD